MGGSAAAHAPRMLYSSGWPGDRPRQGITHERHDSRREKAARALAWARGKKRIASLANSPVGEKCVFHSVQKTTRLACPARRSGHETTRRSGQATRFAVKATRFESPAARWKVEPTRPRGKAVPPQTGVPRPQRQIPGLPANRPTARAVRFGRRPKPPLPPSGDAPCLSGDPLLTPNDPADAPAIERSRKAARSPRQAMSPIPKSTRLRHETTSVISHGPRLFLPALSGGFFSKGWAIFSQTELPFPPASAVLPVDPHDSAA